MSQRPIMDAGPGINFFALNKERLLFATLGALAIPETVDAEIRRKSVQDQRFEAAGRVLGKIPRHLLEILSDDETPELSQAVSRISNLPMKQRMRSGKDLGETMVVAHAAVTAENGGHIFVLIDDGAGRRMVASEQRRLERLRSNGRDVGSISLLSTLGVLERASGGEYLRERHTAHDLYIKLRGLDDGLPPWESTRLGSLDCWRTREE